jgi:Fe-S-cluster containining protein
MASDPFALDPEDFPALEEGAEIRFSCQRCGECCFDQLVTLEPQDLYRLSRGGAAGAKTTAALFDAGVVAFGEAAGRRYCSLGATRFGRAAKCLFLAPTLDEAGALLGWGCSLHAAGLKPLVCALSPVAVSRSPSGRVLRLVPPTPVCPGMGRSSPVPLARYLAGSGVEDALRRSAFFHEEIAPGLIGERFPRAYDFDRYAEIASPDGLDDYLRALVR